MALKRSETAMKTVMQPARKVGSLGTFMLYMTNGPIGLQNHVQGSGKVRMRFVQSSYKVLTRLVQGSYAVRTKFVQCSYNDRTKFVKG